MAAARDLAEPSADRAARVDLELAKQPAEDAAALLVEARLRRVVVQRVVDVEAFAVAQHSRRVGGAREPLRLVLDEAVSVRIDDRGGQAAKALRASCAPLAREAFEPDSKPGHVVLGDLPETIGV
jgi:hypothetical protein